MAPPAKASLPLPDLFSPYTLKGVTLRNRIAMSPMTMYRFTDGLMNDFYVMLMGSRSAGGFGLVFPEQLAVTPAGRTGTHCAGIWDDAQVDGLRRMTAIIRDMGAVPGIQLGHTGRKGSELKPWEGKLQLPPGHRDGWQVRGSRRSPMAGATPTPSRSSRWLRSGTCTATTTKCPYSPWWPRQPAGGRTGRRRGRSAAGPSSARRGWTASAYRHTALAVLLLGAVLWRDELQHHAQIAVRFRWGSAIACPGATSVSPGCGRRGTGMDRSTPVLPSTRTRPYGGGMADCTTLPPIPATRPRNTG